MIRQNQNNPDLYDFYDPVEAELVDGGTAMVWKLVSTLSRLSILTQIDQLDISVERNAAQKLKLEEQLQELDSL